MNKSCQYFIIQFEFETKPQYSASSKQIDIMHKKQQVVFLLKSTYIL